MSLPIDPEESGELLRRARAGERNALDQLLGRYRPRLLERIRLMLGADARKLAESGDLMQEALMATVDRMTELDVKDGRQLLRWMTAVARNRIRATVRTRRDVAFQSLSESHVGWVEEVVDRRGHTPASEADRNEASLRLAEALEEMEEDRRRVIELRSLEELPFREVGRRLDRSEDAARMLHLRAMRELVERMRGGGR